MRGVSSVVRNPRLRSRAACRDAIDVKDDLSRAFVSCMLAGSHAVGGASLFTALNLAHPVMRRLHASASVGLIWRHSSRTLGRRSAAAVSPR
jgi:hypothetical protein